MFVQYQNISSTTKHIDSTRSTCEAKGLHSNTTGTLANMEHEPTKALVKLNYKNC